MVMSFELGRCTPPLAVTGLEKQHTWRVAAGNLCAVLATGRPPSHRVPPCGLRQILEGFWAVLPLPDAQRSYLASASSSSSTSTLITGEGATGKLEELVDSFLRTFFAGGLAGSLGRRLSGDVTGNGGG